MAVSGGKAWRLFEVRVARSQRLSPSFLRVTFAGVDLDSFADNGYDQRVKLVFGDGGGRTMRTYTVRAVRPARREVDVDMVLHEPGPGHRLGPACRWAASARPGDPLAIIGPDVAFDGVHGGVEFSPPGGATVLLGGDETAVPAISVILEQLPAGVRGEALLEVPHPADALDLATDSAVSVQWLPRHRSAPGTVLVPAIRDAAVRLAPALVPTGAAGAVGAVGAVVHTGLSDVDVDREILWEVPPSPGPAHCFAWLAGEAGVITSLRRHLVAELGWDRRSVAFMGYWRQGRAEA